MRLLGRAATAGIVATALGLLASIVAASSQAAPRLAETELFQRDLWTTELELTAADWDTIQPVQHLAGNGVPLSTVAVDGEAAALGYVLPYVRATMRIGDERFEDIGLRVRGNDTLLRALPSRKWSFKIDFNRYVRGQHLGDLTKLNLNNDITDPGFMNDALGYRLYRAAGLAAPRTSYARVFLTVPGRFARRALGLYTVVEEVDARFARDRLGVPAAVFKPFTREVFPYLGSRWEPYRDRFNPQTEVTEADTARVIAFCRTVARASDAEFERDIGRVLDLDAFARFLVVAVWLADPDSALDGGKNFYLLLPQSTRAFVVVPWDLDHAFGQYPFIEPAELQQLDIYAPARRGENDLVARLLRIRTFRTRYLDALAHLIEHDAAPEQIASEVDDLATVIRPAVAEESPAVLADFDRAVSSARVIRSGNGGVPIKPFARARTESVRRQLARR
jgi:spore coat protein H